MVKTFHWTRIFGLVLLIVLLVVSFLFGTGKAMVFYKQYVTQTRIVRGVQNINSATDSIINGIAEIAGRCAREQFETETNLAQAGGCLNLSERELEVYYRRGYFNRIKKALNNKNRGIVATLNDFIKERGIDRVTVPQQCDLRLISDTDDTGDITGIRLIGTELIYQDPIIGTRTEKIDLQISIPKVVFFSGSDDLFDYCMLAGKGIYITGATSSIIGDLYAGSHSMEEVREPELIYGEIMHFGGLNILSTQLAVKADRIVSAEDININGSFVIFTSENEHLNCYAKTINDIKGFAKESLYNLDGDYYPIAEMDEEIFEQYNKYATNARAYYSKLGSIDTYYDSDNDEEYKGPYRKIISSTDVEIDSDFTGLVMTPYNVIIDSDVNFEGLILCGDRIYVRGNNNIVSNRNILRSITAYEEATPGSIVALEYLNGLSTTGLTEPKYYVIPYRNN